MQRTETLRLQNEIAEMPEPIHRYKITITRTRSLNTRKYNLLANNNVQLFDWLV
jgi:hypothetical protein